jgi:hypothetical protein
MDFLALARTGVIQPGFCVCSIDVGKVMASSGDPAAALAQSNATEVGIRCDQAIKKTL